MPYPEDPVVDLANTGQSSNKVITSKMPSWKDVQFSRRQVARKPPRYAVINWMLSLHVFIKDESPLTRPLKASQMATARKLEECQVAAGRSRRRSSTQRLRRTM